jgi:hypothetical protein
MNIIQFFLYFKININDLTEFSFVMNVGHFTNIRKAIVNINKKFIFTFLYISE